MTRHRLMGATLATAAASLVAAGTSQAQAIDTATAPVCTTKVALTFDDGPNETTTPEVLAALLKYKLHGTFFQIGAKVAADPAITADVVARGHVLGNHSMTHPDLTTLQTGPLADAHKAADATATSVEDQIGQSQYAFTGIAKVGAPKLFRLPYGHTGSDASGDDVEAILRARWNLQPALWNVDSRDYESATSQEIVNRVVAAVSANIASGQNSVVLMHDGIDGYSSLTAAALPTIIEQLAAKGACFTTLAPTTAALADPAAMSYGHGAVALVNPEKASIAPATAATPTPPTTTLPPSTGPAVPTPGAPAEHTVPAPTAPSPVTRLDLQALQARVLAMVRSTYASYRGASRKAVVATADRTQMKASFLAAWSHEGRRYHRHVKVTKTSAGNLTFSLGL